MKSDKLSDAIGMIDADLIVQADEKVKKGKVQYLKWLIPVAAVFLIVIAIIPFLKQDKPKVDKPSVEQLTSLDEQSTNDGNNLNNQAPSTELNGNEPSTEKPTSQTITPSADDNPLLPKVYSLSLAKYPKTVKYPSDWSNMTDWEESRKERRAYYGAGKNLDVFFKKTYMEFLTGAGKNNKLYSPLNVYMALAMTAEITGGESRQQILSLLGAESIEALRKQANSVWNANYSDDGAVTSILASSIWLDKNVKFNENTLQFLTSNYYASSYQGQMGSNEMNKALQGWLNQQTGGLLSDRISDIELDAQTIMALATTIFYQARWNAEFNEDYTSKRAFHSPSGDVTCDFMNRKEYGETYYWGDNFSAVGRRLANSGRMFFILPDENVSVDALLRDSEALSFMTSNGKWSQNKKININLSIPRFDASSNCDLVQNLKNLGVVNCFNSVKSDFSPLCENKGISISRVEHGVRVAIDEEGVVATAYTVEALAGSTRPPEEEIDFIVDRPFIFVITSEDGLPLFTGVINQP